MSKILRLSESQLVEMIKKIINEQDETSYAEPEPELYTIAMKQAGKEPDNEIMAEDDDDDDDDSEY